MNDSIKLALSLLHLQDQYITTLMYMSSLFIIEIMTVMVEVLVVLEDVHALVTTMAQSVKTSNDQIAYASLTSIL
jgi:hypothetical protein